MRRPTVVAGLATASLLLGACGGSAGEERKPDAAPQDISTEIAPPKPTSAQTFKGQSLSEADTKRLTSTLNAALGSGDKRQFLSVFDPGRTDLVDQQATWFDNVRKVPMKVRRMVLVKARDTRDSSGRDTLKADLGFEHQITGADRVPAAEWYSFEFKKAGAKLLVTKVAGAAADESSGEKFSRYYRQAWDDGAMAVVRGRKTLLLGPAADEATMKRLVGGIDAAIDTQVKRFRDAGARLPDEVLNRSWVFTLQSPEVADVFDYFGGQVKPLEADFSAVANPVYVSDPVLGHLETDRPALTTRIVLDRSLLGESDPGTTIRHELVHALEHTWQHGNSSAPRWATEGAAVALSTPSAAERSFRMNAGIGYLRTHDLLPTDKEFYRGDNAAVASHYGAGYIACAYLAHLRGDKGLVAALRAMDEPDADLEKILRMSETKFAKEALAWAS